MSARMQSLALGRRYGILAALIAIVLMATPVWGWGKEGHRIIGAIAWYYLSDQAKAGIKDLIGDQNLADVGSWADEVRSNKEYSWSKHMHYINVPRSATTVDESRDCKHGDCVIAAIDRFAKVLRDKDAPKDQRVEALKFLVHFVEDVHQPLHVSYDDDSGGNAVKVTWNGKTTNLHAVWDTNLIQQRLGGGDTNNLASILHGKITETQLKKWQAGPIDPIAWANESLTVTRRLYQEMPKDTALGKDYYQANIATVEERLEAGGVRLAMMLNSIFGGKGSSSTAPSASQSASSQPDNSTQPTSQPATVADAASFIEIVAGESCGNAGGKIMAIVNNHETRSIRVKVRRSWTLNGKPSSTEQTYVVQPGKSYRKALGCSAAKAAGGGTHTFEWTVVNATFAGVN